MVSGNVRGQLCAGLSLGAIWSGLVVSTQPSRLPWLRTVSKRGQRQLPEGSVFDLLAIREAYETTRSLVPTYHRYWKRGGKVHLNYELHIWWQSA